jgi:hypothetical protein
MCSASMHYHVLLPVFQMESWVSCLCVCVCPSLITSEAAGLLCQIQIEVFWVVMPRSVVIGYERSGGPCCFHLQNAGALKCWYPTTTLDSVITQKTSTRNFTVTMKTSNLVLELHCEHCACGDLPL